MSTVERLWKLTDAHDQTQGECQWGEGVTHTASGEGELCTAGWIHAYTDPLLAVLLNPIHANFQNPHLWEAEGIIGKTDHGLKVGCTTLTTLRRVDIPAVTTEQRARFAILCALAVPHSVEFATWARGWLGGSDRSAAWAEKAVVKARALAAAEWAVEAGAGTVDLAVLAREAVLIAPTEAVHPGGEREL